MLHVGRPRGVQQLHGRPASWSSRTARGGAGTQDRGLPGLVGAPAGPGRAAGRADLRGQPGRRRRRPRPDPPPRRAPGQRRAAVPGRRSGRRTTSATVPSGWRIGRRLGADQEAWFTEASRGEHGTWNLIGNPVVLGGIDGGNDTVGAAYHLDTWDGLPDARAIAYRAARRHRQPGRAHRRLPRRDADRRARATVRAGHGDRRTG